MANDSHSELQEALALKASGAKRADVHSVIGWALKSDGRFEEAIVEFGQGLALAPDDLSLLIGVGFSLMELGRQAEAARVFEAAIRTHPDSPDARFGYGWAAENLGALAQAQTAWEQTLARKPDHADAMAGLAGLAARRRDWAVTRSMAESALHIDADNLDALINLIRANLGERAYAEAEANVRRVLARDGLKTNLRADAEIMLGDALDGLGRKDEAFVAYSNGKAIARAAYAGEFARPDVPPAESGVRRLLVEFRSTPMEAWRNLRHGPSGPARTHGFLMGFPRSGTTLLETILGSHPEVTTLEERASMIKAELEFVVRKDGVTRLAGVLEDFLEPYREDYWRRVADLGVDVRDKVFVDKHPFATVRLPLIHKMFPSAKILFAVRDPRDVVFSCFRRAFKMNHGTYTFTDLEEAARYYAAAMEAGAVYRAELDLDLHMIRYEDLVADFEGQVRAFCDFLGLSWSDDLTAFAERARSGRIATPSSAQVARGLYSEGVGQWRDYAEHLAPIMPILAPWVEAFGYAP
jgi:tetratricopeptide (TPR) repeat protein